jgi:hypothetical protein
LEETGNNGTQEGIRQLRRQLEDRMIELGFSAEEREILLNMQPYKARWLINRLIIYDNMRSYVEAHLAHVILLKIDITKDLPASTRLEIAHRMMPGMRKAFIRTFSSDEAPAIRAQMPMASRIAFMTEEKGRVLWKK